MERTCLIIKPDGVGKRVIGEIIRRFENEGMKLVGVKMLEPGRKALEGFYSVHRGKHFFEPFINFVISSPVVVCVWESHDAITRTRSIIGATNSKDALPGTLRNLFGTDNRRNIVHASDSPENAKKEIAFFFKDSELFEYDWDSWINK
jgi:nucleoside-diphosphate kinase